MEISMAVCQECDTPLDFDVEDAEEGDVITCAECGAEYEIVATEPLELSRLESDEIDDDEDRLIDTDDDE